MIRYLMLVLLLGGPATWWKSDLLKEKIDRQLEDPCFLSASVGVSVYDLTTGQTLYDFDAEKALPPASTLKIWTTAMALEVLGSDFQFQTALTASGTIRQDTLFGDIVIVGGGDPSLASQYFDQNIDQLLQRWVTKIREAGISHVTGSVIADASLTSPDLIAPTWPYQDLGNYYGAYHSGLNVHDNQFFLRFKQNFREGQRVSIDAIYPEVPDLVVKSLVRTGPPGSGDQAYIMGGPYQDQRYVQGTIPPGGGTFRIKGSLPDPGKFLAHHLMQRLEDASIVCQGGSISTAEPLSLQNNLPLDIWYSPPLKAIATLTNQRSVNLFAQSLGITAIQQSDFKDLSSYWEGQGIDMTGIRTSDYAGLAQDNAISTRSMVQILSWIYSDPSRFEAFRSTLAVAGRSGTLSSLLKNSQAQGHIYAKSGLISGVRSYAGYIHRPDGHWIAFAILTQNPACSGYVIRKKLAQLMETMYLSI